MIEIKSVSILIGLTFVSLNNSLVNSLKGTKLKIISNIAPIKVISQ